MELVDLAFKGAGDVGSSHPAWSGRQLRFLARCLTEALHDALRVAESCGRRLA